MLLLFGFVYSYLVCFGSTVLFVVPIKLHLIVIESWEAEPESEREGERDIGLSLHLVVLSSPPHMGMCGRECASMHTHACMLVRASWLCVWVCGLDRVIIISQFDSFVRAQSSGCSSVYPPCQEHNGVSTGVCLIPPPSSLWPKSHNPSLPRCVCVSWGVQAIKYCDAYSVYVRCVCLCVRERE